MNSIPEIDVRKQVILTNSYKDYLNPLDFSSLKNWVYSLGDDEVMKISSDLGWNLEKYGNFEWTKEIVNLYHAGLWPGMKNLDPIYTKGSVMDSSNLVGFLDSKNIPSKLSENIRGISDSFNFTKFNFPPIFLEGQLIRERDSSAEKFDYDVWDGNSRCLAYALGGLSEIEGYIGRLV
ncbi:MAG: hypothetical protein KC516_02645 [Nanoarchaeota archaeon]|nr:hypothetical protein [Nanoarchaeota archaeon]